MNKAAAFTLVELITVIFIVSLLLVLGIPSFNHLRQSQQAKLTVGRLSQAIRYARSQALHTGLTVVLCPSADKQHCDADWHKPWIVFVDKENTRELNTADELLREYPGLKKDETLSFKAFISHAFLAFSPYGFNTQQNGSFVYTLYTKHAIFAQTKLVLNKAGRLRVERLV